MKDKLIKEVEDAEYKELLQRAEKCGMPSYAVPRPSYSDKTANGLTALIVKYCKMHGWHAERINTTGRVINNQKIVSDVLGHKYTIGSVKFIPTAGFRGSADIHILADGKAVYCEVKIGNDRQSEYQRMFQRSVEAAGGHYIIAKCFADFVTDITRIV